MTDKEKAIVTAYTGITMLAGDKFPIFHKYIEDILGRPVWTHELANPSVWEEIKEKSRKDFIELCREDETEITDDDLRVCMAESHHLGYELAEIKFKRPQGKWIKNEGRDLRDCFYTCSKCGRNINVICGETLADYPFCHCGADMRGSK